MTLVESGKSKNKWKCDICGKEMQSVFAINKADQDLCADCAKALDDDHGPGAA